VNWLTFAVQWLHVLLGIVWFGYAVTMHFLVGPTLAQLPETQGRITVSRLGEVGTRVFPIVGLLVLALGILRGTVFGQIQSFEALTTTYGIVWMVALLGTVALFFNGARFIGPTFEGLRDAPDYASAMARLRRYTWIDIGLFTVVFTCMILMRFNFSL
jgi:uncharacterized membrane protein